MSLVAIQVNPNTPVDMGPVLQCYLLPANMGAGLATTIAASSSVQATVITGGFKNFSFGVKSTQAGTVSIQRYIDAAATMPIGSAITASLTANTAASCDSVDSIPYQSMVITVSNSSGTNPATLSNCALLLQAN